MKRFRAALAVALLSPLAAWAARDITVLVDMTPVGRKAVHPTPEKPAYYVPVMRGYREMGEVAAGEQPPSAHDVVKLVAPELAKQGYRVVDQAHAKPDLIIDIAWGYITPTDDPNAFNANQRAALVLGNTFFNVMSPEDFGHDMFMDAVNDRRYFVVITAYDFGAWTKEHRKQILWKAKMSVPADGLYFGDVLAPLVKAGGPQFGRETIGTPQLVPVVPEGRVRVGEPVVKP